MIKVDTVVCNILFSNEKENDMLQYKISENTIRRVVKNSKSLASVIKKLGFSLSGGGYQAVKNLIKKYNLSTSHFYGQGWAKNKNIKLYKYNLAYRSLKKILVKNSTYTNNNCLKKRLINAGIFEYRCIKCGNDKWLDLPIPLQLEHKNGVKFDNRIENLELLCPNCHAFTPTYAGRNKVFKNLIMKDKEKHIVRVRSERIDMIKEKRKLRELHKEQNNIELKDQRKERKLNVIKNRLIDVERETKSKKTIGNLAKKWAVNKKTVLKFLREYKPDFRIS